MTRDQARGHARKRWGRTAEAFTSGPLFYLRRSGKVRGVGTSWALAFADADRRTAGESDRTKTQIERLHCALRAAVLEHGADLGSLGCTELWHLYGGPPPILQGRLGREHYSTPIVIVDTLVRYDVEVGRFIVEPRGPRPGGGTP